MLVSWLTDRPEGFSEAELELFDRITPTLALVKNAALSIETTRTLLDVYLGRDAARRVLSGNIVRGRAEPITAVIWFSDLADFTRIADSLPREQLLVLLNDYAEVIVASLEAHGGNVLKFMGDGMLAIFPGSDVGAAAARAFAAAHAARRAVAEVGVRRAAAGLAVSDLYLALHVGELLYGNFGGPSRLDFTVLGPAVSGPAACCAVAHARLQGDPVPAFAQALGRRDALVSLGRWLRGVALPQELFTPDPTAARDPTASPDSLRPTAKAVVSRHPEERPRGSHVGNTTTPWKPATRPSARRRRWRRCRRRSRMPGPIRRSSPRASRTSIRPGSPAAPRWPSCRCCASRPWARCRRPGRRWAGCSACR